MGFNADNPTHLFRLALTDIVQDGKWVGQKREGLYRMGHIMYPTERGSDHEYIETKLNELHGEDHLQETKEWTFPDDVNTGLTGEITAKNQPSDSYFARLCQSKKGNQIQSMVDKLDKWGRNNRTVAQVFQVDNDLNAMFPPCLLSLQAMYREGDVNLIAHFRSHTICKSYYGDVMALGDLAQYLADQISADVGEVIVISSSLHIRKDNDEHKLAEEMYNELFDMEANL